MYERKTQIIILMIVLVLFYPIFSPLFLQIPYSRRQIFFSPQTTPNNANIYDEKAESQNVMKYPSGSTWLNFTDDITQGKPPDIFLKSSDHQRIVIGAKFFGMWNWTEDHDLSPTKTIRFETFEIPLTGHRTEVGDPQLPMVTRFIEVPRDVDVTVEIVYNTSVMLQRNYFVYPYQGYVIPINWSGAPPTYLNLSTVYNPFHLYYYPTNRVQLSGQYSQDPILIRGHRVVALNIFPVTFSAFTNNSLVYPNMEIALKYNQQATIQRPPANLISPIFDELLKALILNYKPLAQPYPDSNQLRIKLQSLEEAADYLIITTDAFREAVEPLAAWKQRKGLLTKTVTVQEITQETSSEAIRTAISEYIENS
ncbi:MAG: C25 family cysteine peptidase, partial [Promethearchaeota archaeon]